MIGDHEFQGLVHHPGVSFSGEDPASLLQLLHVNIHGLLQGDTSNMAVSDLLYISPAPVEKEPVDPTSDPSCPEVFRRNGTPAPDRPEGTRRKQFGLGWPPGSDQASRLIGKKISPKMGYFLALFAYFDPIKSSKKVCPFYTSLTLFTLAFYTGECREGRPCFPIG